ncbi:hypothetical protein GN958_ATG08822 [Phytophthora infestans]|uniref:BED-type domain-containing protein n=1 Tax=Phytophthora infestans TaxID=4787 RepID=A0A8S9UN08_PHYIN|nr:hypothetical protein GN958_ATG08822 [Phytophthora infestans]
MELDVPGNKRHNAVHFQIYHCGDYQAPRKRDVDWSEVDVDADDYVYCLRCESAIHKLGFTHIDRVKRHLRETCAKRPRQEVVTSYFPPQVDAATQSLFNKMSALWMFSAGMTFYKAQHATCAAVFRLLHPMIEIPSQYLIRDRLLDECYEDSISNIRVSLSMHFCLLVTDGWTDINGDAVITYLVISGDQTFFLESV